MLYLGTASTESVRDAMSTGLLGQLRQPNVGHAVVPGALWAADNGAFSQTRTFEPDRWHAWLAKQPTDGCLFAVVPDVVGDHAATLELWHEWATIVRDLGHRPAFVLQDGCGPGDIPVDTDCVFVGGSTDYKLSFQAVACMKAAKERGCWVHVGRVNSRRRIRWCADILTAGGEPVVDSVDGTFLAFGPDVNLPRLLSWLHPDQPGFFGGVA